MGGLGGNNPFPMKLGGAADGDLEVIQEAFAEALGSALAKERGTVSWVENHAIARVLWALYAAAQRLANQWDPKKMTVFLERWEDILLTSPLPTDTDAARRTRVGLKMSLIGAGTTGDILRTYLETAIPEIYVDLVFTDPLDATTYVPGGGSVPGGGPTFLDGDLIGPFMSPYASSVAYMAILIEKPDSMSDNTFYALAARVYDDVDGLIGAWMDFDWVRDGGNGAGFYLDENFNLDNQRFD